MKDLIGCGLDELLDSVAGSDPAPGGGSAAALAGGLASSLVCMAARIALRGKGLNEGSTQELIEILQQANSLKDRLCGLVQEDARAYMAFVEARRMPSADDEQRAAAREALSQASMAMTLVPMTVMRDSFEALGMLRRLTELASPATMTDIGVAAELASAAINGARMNVLVNLPNLPEHERAKLEDDARMIIEHAAPQVEAVIEAVKSALK